MTKTAFSKPSRLAQFISERINDLRPRRSQLEIATAAGFGGSPNMLSMVKSGRAKLSLDKVAALARALECDPSHLTRLALAQFYTPSVLKLILDAAPAPTVSPDPLPSRRPESAHATAAALGVEVRLALREVRLAWQFAKNAVPPAEHAYERLTRLKAAIDSLVVETRGAAD